MVRKAMIIGLDSMVPELIHKFCDEGVLPHIKKLMSEGTFGEGFCTHPSLTGTNWTSIVCGTWPSTQGTSCMWTHFKGEPLNRVHSSFLSTSSHCEPLWMIGEKVGKRSILMKYPCTVPPTITKGIQVEGTGAPWYGLNPFEIAPCMCFSNQSYPMAQKVELTPATGWTHLPTTYHDPFETRIEVNSKSTESQQALHLLVIATQEIGYDQILLTKSKDAKDTVAQLSIGEWSRWIQAEFKAQIPLYIKYREDSRIVYEDQPVKNYTGTLRFKLIELSPDASRIRLYQSQVFPTTGFTWPTSIASELLTHIGPFQEHIGPTADFNNWIDDETFLEELEYQSWWLGMATNYLMTHYEWDLYFLQWHGLNHAQHTFWGGIDPISPWYRNENSSYYWKCFKRFYHAADLMIGDILKHADSETLVIVIADHGHIPYVYGSAMVANALISAQLLTYTHDSDNQLVVDWSQTKAYPINSVHIYVNTKGRDPHGIVEPGMEYEEVCNRVIDTLLGIRDPKNNCPFAFVLKKEDTENMGLFGDQVGDVVYGMRGGYISSLEPTDDLELFKFPKGAISVTDDWADRAGPLPANTSIHGSTIPSTRLGLGSIRVPLIIKGPNIKKDYVMRGHFRLIDIAPTVSHILGIPTPTPCDGSIILEILL